MARQDSSDITEWTNCSPGTLTQLNLRLRASQKRKTAKRVAVPLLLLTFIGIGALSLDRVTTPADLDFGGVTCTQVQSELNQYAMGQLSSETQNAFDIHLAKCPRCQERMRAMPSKFPMPTRVSFGQLREKMSIEGFATHRLRLAGLVK